MNKMIRAALAATAIVALAAPAFAATTSGTVIVNGTVAASCSAVTPITGTITVNEMALTTGLVNTTFSNQSGGLTRDFQVLCTNANPKIQVSSDALHQTGVPTVSGYTGVVHYTSTLSADLAGGGTASTAYTTADVLPAASSTTLGATKYFATGSNNLHVTISAAHTTGATDVLFAGNYTSTITITVSPS